MLDKKADAEITKIEMLLKGMAGETASDAILNQEAHGQAQFVNSAVLPIECPRFELEGLGFVFGENHDDIFVNVIMPGGWSKKATGHSMWSDLLDAKGHVRGGIFYKAAFYDRSAHMHLERRFNYRIQPINGYESDDYAEADRIAVVVDACSSPTIIFKTEPVGRKDYPAHDLKEKEAKAWLSEHYPNWDNVLAYWE